MKGRLQGRHALHWHALLFSQLQQQRVPVQAQCKPCAVLGRRCAGSGNRAHADLQFCKLAYRTSYKLWKRGSPSTTPWTKSAVS